jgi:hypothetical protein
MTHRACSRWPQSGPNSQFVARPENGQPKNRPSSRTRRTKGARSRCRQISKPPPWLIQDEGFLPLRGNDPEFLRELRCGFEVDCTAIIVPPCAARNSVVSCGNGVRASIERADERAEAASDLCSNVSVDACAVEGAEQFVDEPRAGCAEQRPNSGAVPPEPVRRLWTGVACDRGQTRSPNGVSTHQDSFRRGSLRRDWRCPERHRNGAPTPTFRRHSRTLAQPTHCYVRSLQTCDYSLTVRPTSISLLS